MFRLLKLGWIAFALAGGGSASALALYASDPHRALITGGLTLVAVLAALLIDQDIPRHRR